MGRCVTWYLVLTISFAVNAIENEDYTFGTFFVMNEDDGTPSLDTGLYLLSQAVPYDGTLRELDTCGYVVANNTGEGDADVLTQFFFVTAYRQVGSNYQRLYNPLPFAFSINGNETFGCRRQRIDTENAVDFRLQEGDRIGIFIQESPCVTFSGTFACPAHVNLVDTEKNCSKVIYYPNTAPFTGINLPPSQSVNSGNPEGVYMNMDVIIEPASPLPSNESIPSFSCSNISHTNTNNLLGLIALAGIATIIAVMSTIAGVLGYYFCKRKTKKAPITVTDGIVDSQYDAYYYAVPVDSIGAITKNGAKKVSKSNEYSVSIGSSHRVANEQDAPDDLLEGELDSEYDYADEDEYWEPAEQEMQLKEQLVELLNVKEISINNIEIQRELGSGQFANVYCGLWREGEGVVTEVAIKMLKGEATDEKRVQFLREAATMGQFDHPNILKILAFAYDDDNKPTIIVDLMLVGDLHHHLLTLRPKEGTVPSEKLSSTLLSYSRQIAFGMLYLGCKKFIHCDLAARNVLVSNDGTCKISDFGLSRNLHHEDYYVSHGGKVPVKWTAPEALHYRKYSTASDVWSYGCLLYEIWSLGCKPFSKLSNIETLRKIESGYRLPPPPGCPEAIYTIMIKCWNPEPKQRPPFLKMVVALQRPDFQTLQWSRQEATENHALAKRLGAPLANGEGLYVTLQRRYMNSTQQNPETIPRSI